MDPLIKDIPKNERPREKAINDGVQTLSDAELMAIIFSTGIKGKSVIQVCKEILDSKQGHLSRVTKMSVRELCDNYKGIGEAKAVTLLAALQLGARAARDAITDTDIPVIRSSEFAYEYMRHHFEALEHEEFWILLIDRAGKAKAEVRISQGGTVATTVDVKLILKAAISQLASGIILFHNHPSGTLRPSPEDDRLTQKIVDAARLIDVAVHDHLIVTRTSFYSYADNGKL